MSILIISWQLFTITFSVMLLLTFIMSLQSLHFYTSHVVEERFSILELEIPATPMELANLIRGLYKLSSRAKSIKALKSLRWQLCIDFLFMPSAYGSIFLLCMLVAAKMQSPFGSKVFIVFAWAQVIPWICDVIENIYLLRKIKPKPVLSTLSVHKAYLHMEYIKWAIALGAAICAVAAISYFWLAGNYNVHSLYYLAIIAGEVILFFILGKFFLKKKKKKELVNQQGLYTTAIQ